jgi:hypothetical protein
MDKLRALQKRYGQTSGASSAKPAAALPNNAADSLPISSSSALASKLSATNAPSAVGTFACFGITTAHTPHAHHRTHADMLFAML